MIWNIPLASSGPCPGHTPSQPLVHLLTGRPWDTRKSLAYGWLYWATQNISVINIIFILNLKHNTVPYTRRKTLLQLKPRHCNKQDFKWYLTESESSFYGVCHRPAPPGAGCQALGIRLVGSICFQKWGFLEWQGSTQAFPTKFNLASVLERSFFQAAVALLVITVVSGICLSTMVCRNGQWKCLFWFSAWMNVSGF